MLGKNFNNNHFRDLIRGQSQASQIDIEEDHFKPWFGFFALRDP